jgi:hypothetical protein
MSNKFTCPLFKRSWVLDAAGSRTLRTRYKSARFLLVECAGARCLLINLIHMRSLSSFSQVSLTWHGTRRTRATRSKLRHRPSLSSSLPTSHLRCPLRWPFPSLAIAISSRLRGLESSRHTMQSVCGPGTSPLACHLETLHMMSMFNSDHRSRIITTTCRAFSRPLQSCTRCARSPPVLAR